MRRRAEPRFNQVGIFSNREVSSSERKLAEVASVIPKADGMHHSFHLVRS